MTEPDGTGKDLLERAAAGDVDAFVELVRPVQASLRALCARLTPRAAGPDAADDLAQEALLAAFESIRSFKPSGAGGDARPDIGAWLRGIARNKARMALRREYVRRDALETLVRRETELRTSERARPGEEMLGALRQCVRSLAERSRRMLDLVYGHGLVAPVSREEAAGRLGMSCGALYTALTRTRQGLRRCVEKRLAGGRPGDEWA